ncbi:hypothetical protein [Streptomyces afghaniensis]|uniref:hypothetical protein n=1 Tax=Streptomyces afghaniensis TaxID=66865 RepID=UPI00277D4405|nr:hypothetical protein [Streptomyces afghaniensis]MDQ1016731.1 hypothetical protein [Streptomyces afghaniensis]
MSTSATPWYIKGILYVALPAACLAALYLSIPGEVTLARTAGWSEHYAPAMPICLSVYALSAGAISTYRRKMKLPGQTTALVGSLMSLLLAMSAQSISHLIEQDYMGTSAALVVAVSCVPPLTIAHLVHMAETPSAVKTFSQQLEELRDENQGLMTALVAAEAENVLSHAWGVLAGFGGVSRATGELVEWAEGETKALDAELERAEKDLKSKSRRAPLALTREKIEKTRETLAAEGKKVTVERVCEALGVSTATYYRHLSAV